MIKKLLLGVFVFSFLIINNQVNAATIPSSGCNGTNTYNAITRKKCPDVGSVLGASLTVTPDPTPRIMYWWGKVNQHIDSNGIWQTDPDGVSGANLDKLTYCKKWYPNTTSVTPYQMETIDSWHNAGNTSNYTATVMSDQCVAEIQQSRSLTVTSPHGGEVFQTGQQITITWTSTGYGPGSTLAIDLVKVNPDTTHSNTFLMSASNLTNDGTETLTIPGNVPNATTYGIHMSIYDPATTLWQDAFSNGMFTIQALQTFQCSDNIDNDNDGLVDYPNDPGCTSVTDNDELNIVTNLSVTVVSPNGGEVFQQGTPISISWKDGRNGVKIGLMTPDYTIANAAGILGWIESNGSAVGSTVWNGKDLKDAAGGPMPPAVPGQYKIIAVSQDVNGNYIIQHSGTQVGVYPDNTDVSNAAFTLQSPSTSTCTATSAPYVKIVSPTDGSSYTSGQQLLVKWESCRFLPTDIGSLVIMNSNGTQYPLAINNTLNDGQELITIPTVPTNGVWDLAIKFDGAGYAASDDIHINIQNATTSTCPTSNSPKVTVLAPNGGENYFSGDSLVTWKSCKISATALMRIDLVMYKPNGNTITKVLATGIPNSGTKHIILPTTTTWPQMVYGNNFKIRVRKGNSTIVQDQSDNKFSIMPVVPAKVTVMLDPTNPPAGTVMVNNTASTNNVTVLKFQVKAENSDLTLRKIPIQFASSTGNVSAKINTLKLYKGTDLVDSIDGSNGYIITSGVITTTPTSANLINGYIFSNLSTPYNKVLAGTTANFTIAVDFKALSGNYSQGESLTASITNADVLLSSNFSVQDNNGDNLPPSQKFGSAIGSPQTLRTSGVSVVMNPATISAISDNNGNITQVTYTIPLLVSAYGGTYYIGQTTQQSVAATGTNAIAYGFNRSTSPAILSTIEGASSTIYSSDAIIEGNGYRVDDGTTKHFYMTVNLITPSVPNSNYRVSLSQLRAFTNGMLTTGAMNMDLLPVSSYQTAYQFINN